jgi:DNA-binding NarL/FixJ family response regulator
VAVVPQRSRSDVATTVVLVDDHQVVLDGLERLLSAAGFDVLAAIVDPDEALAAVRRFEPTLCVIDLRLAGTSGVALTAAVRAASPATAVAILTSFDDGAAAREAVEAGATGFLIKDLARQDLCDQLRNVAAGSLVIDRRVASAVMQPSPTQLTPRERSVLRLLADGKTNRVIAAELNVSPHTVKDHVSRLMRKLGASTRTELVAMGLRSGQL